jgi:hypothetical protein
VITVRTPTGDRAIGSVTVRTPTGDAVVARMVLRTPTGDSEIYTQAGGGALTAEASPFSAVGSVSGSGTQDVTSNLVTVTPSGGTSPYTYAWARISGDSDVLALNSTAAATRFQATIELGGFRNATFRCTVTDARARTGTVDVDVSLFNFGGFL